MRDPKPAGEFNKGSIKRLAILAGLKKTKSKDGISRIAEDTYDVVNHFIKARTSDVVRACAILAGHLRKKIISYQIVSQILGSKFYGNPDGKFDVIKKAKDVRSKMGKSSDAFLVMTRARFNAYARGLVVDEDIKGFGKVALINIQAYVEQEVVRILTSAMDIAFLIGGRTTLKAKDVNVAITHGCKFAGKKVAFKVPEQKTIPKKKKPAPKKAPKKKTSPKKKTTKKKATPKK